MSLEPKFEPVPIKEILNGCINGEAEGWNKFFEKFHRLITGVIYKNIKEDPEDFVQSVYLKLIENDYYLLRKFKGETQYAFLLYLKEISKNTIKQEKKRKYNYEKALSFCELNEDELIEFNLNISTDDRLDWMQAMIMELSIDFREVLYLKLKGFKAREIAEILDIPINTVLSRIRRGIRKIKKNKKLEIKNL